jgi:hypothetical protein
MEGFMTDQDMSAELSSIEEHVRQNNLLSNGIGEAKELLAKERSKRLADAGAKIQSILDRYEVTLLAQPVFTDDGRVQARVVLTDRRE